MSDCFCCTGPKGPARISSNKSTRWGKSRRTRLIRWKGWRRIGARRSKTRRGGLIRRGQRGDEETLEVARGSDGTAGPEGSGYVVSTPGPGTVCPPSLPSLFGAAPAVAALALPWRAVSQASGRQEDTGWGRARARAHPPRSRTHSPYTRHTPHRASPTPHATLAHCTVPTFSPPFALGDLVGPNPAPADRVTGPL